MISSALYAGTMHSFLDDSINSVVEDPGYYESQTRGLYSLGGAKVKFNNQGSFTPVNIEMPSIQSGCGGIDATFGGFSYLNVDYLVEKLKAISAAAPAFAFQMALGVLCEDCKTTLNWLENIANQINNLNLDTCKAAERIGAPMGTRIGENMKQMSLFSGQSNNYNESTDNAKARFNILENEYVNTIAYYMGGNTSLAKKELEKQAFQGSLIETALENSSGIDMSIFGTTTNGKNLYTSLIRSLIGDVVGYKTKITGNANNENGNTDGKYKTKIIPYESPNYKLFLYGGEISYIDVVLKADNHGMPDVTVVKIKNFKGVKEIFKLRIESIIEQMKLKQALSPENRNFINSMPIPIAKYLNTHILSSTESNIESLTEYLAIKETRAFLDFIIRAASKAIASKMINESDNKSIEDIEAFVKPITIRITEFKKEINKWYEVASKNWTTNKLVNDYYKELEQRMKSRLSNSGTFNAHFN